MPVVLVTGGSGFIGRHVVEALYQCGAQIRVLDVMEPGRTPSGVEIHRGSILDAACLTAAMRGMTDVFHVAGISHLWTRRRADFAEVDASETAKVLAAAAEAHT